MIQTTTIRKFWKDQVVYLEKGPYQEYYVPAERSILKMLSWYYKVDYNQLNRLLDQNIKQKDKRQLTKYLNQLWQGEPFEYITREAAFNELILQVDSSVLIPRPETEELYTLVKKDVNSFLMNNEGVKVADLCTGSGCLAVHIAHDFKQAQVWATDCSSQSLNIAKENIYRYHVQDRVRLIQVDVASDEMPLFDFIVSNPPYLRTDEIEKLDFWVKEKEPHLALDGGEDGLKIIKRVIKKGFFLLKSGGTMYIEIGHEQAKSVLEIIEKQGMHGEINRDICGKDRFIKIFNK